MIFLKIILALLISALSLYTFCAFDESVGNKTLSVIIRLILLMMSIPIIMLFVIFGWIVLCIDKTLIAKKGESK